MRALFLGVLLLAGLGSQATAQLTIGPTAINTNVNGVPITISVTSWITVNSVDNEPILNVRLVADLIDLQKKFSNVVATLNHYGDNCANRGIHNQSSVVSLKNGSLWPLGDQLILSMHGHIDVWSCVAGHSKSEIRWRKKKIGFVDVKLPVFHTWTNMKKTKYGTQLFHGNVAMQLEKDNASVALEISEPNVNLEEQEFFVTNDDLEPAKVNISQKAYIALQSAINLAKLKEIFPKELRELNMTVVSARFRDIGGHAIADINLTARVSGNFADSILYLQ